MVYENVSFGWHFLLVGGGLVVEIKWGFYMYEILQIITRLSVQNRLKNGEKIRS